MATLLGAYVPKTHYIRSGGAFTRCGLNTRSLRSTPIVAKYPHPATCLKCSGLTGAQV